MATALAVMATLVVYAASTSALVTHEYLTRLTEVPAPAPSNGPLVEPQALTVDSGDLYVADGSFGAGEGRIDRFDATTHAWISQFEAAPSLSFMRSGIAVGHSTGEAETYVGADLAGTQEGAVGVFGPAGTLQGTWTGADTPAGAFGCFECNGPGDVAVDESGNALTEGDVYVSAPAQSVVDVFAPRPGGGEEYLTQIAEREPGVPLTEVFGVAVDQQSGDVLVIDTNGIDVFEPGAAHIYTLLRRITATSHGPFRGLTGLTVDAANGDIFAADREPRVIDQFSSAGAFIGQITRSSTGPIGDITGSLAVDPTSHEIYVGDRPIGSEYFIDAFGPDLVLPDVATAPASELTPTSAVLNGTVDPDEAGAATCEFEWGTTPSFGQVAPCSEAVQEGNAAAPVHAAITGLTPGTTYYFRLTASNASGSNPGEASQDQSFTTTGTRIDSTSSTDVTGTTATLEASIDPNGSPTTYFFEYGTSNAYGSSTPTPPGASIGSGIADVEVGVPIQGLAPGTTYHYRVIARREVSAVLFEESAGPDATFTTQLSAASGLPDGRAYELVSPPDKHGSLLLAINAGGGDGLIQASASGTAISYLANGPTEGEPAGNSQTVQVLSRRAGTQAAPWLSQDIATPHSSAVGVSLGPGQGEYRFFSSDLSSAVVQPRGPFRPLSSVATERTAYLRADYPAEEPSNPCLASCYQPLVTAGNVPAATRFGEEGEPGSLGPAFEGASPDASHVVLSSRAALTEGAPTAPDNTAHTSLYEWSAGRLKLVSIRPQEEGGEPFDAGAAALGFSNNEITTLRIVRNAISEDGSRVVWSETGEQSNHHLFLRDTEVGHEQTIRLDLEQGGSGNGAAAPVFQTASTDDSRIFFTDTQQLVTGASESGADLYEYDLDRPLGERLIDLTPGGSTHPADVLGLIAGASDDGSAVYFTANGKLTSEPSPRGEEAVAGDCNSNTSQVNLESETGPQRCNLYMRRNGQTQLVAVLSGADFTDWSLRGAGGLRTLTARLSPNGRYLAFMSQRSLTGYDNHDAGSGKPDQEVFLYDTAVDGGQSNLVCASCDPTGARPHGVEYARINTDRGGRAGGSGIWSNSTWIAASVPGWTAISNSESTSLHQSRYLSNAGRLFFNSADALVPKDTNGTEDVYEYEPPNSTSSPPPDDSCTTASPTFTQASGGCLSLISTGTSKEESAFMDASETGNDVFFLTSSQLSKRDEDSAADLYDARVGGGEAEPVKPVECAGDACQQPAVPPNDATPGSLSFNGAGNLTACPKGKQLKKGKCVKKAKKKKHHKSHKKSKKKTKRKGDGQKRANSKHGGHE